MKKQLFILGLNLLLAVFFNACVSNETADSDKVAQSEIYQSYSVSYSVTDGKMTLFASFRFGGNAGTTLRLVKPSGVTWNGKEMTAENNIFQGTYYELVESGDPSGTHVFVFTDTQNKVYTNKIQLLSAEPLISEGPHSVSKGIEIRWVGPALREGETISCNIKDSTTTHSFSTSMKGQESFFVTPEQLGTVKKGLVNLYFKRSYSPSLAEATHLGGSIEAVYESKTYSFQLTD